MGHTLRPTCAPGWCATLKSATISQVILRLPRAWSGAGGLAGEPHGSRATPEPAKCRLRHPFQQQGEGSHKVRYHSLSEATCAPKPAGAQSVRVGQGVRNPRTKQADGRRPGHRPDGGTCVVTGRFCFPQVDDQNNRSPSIAEPNTQPTFRTTEAFEWAAKPEAPTSTNRNSLSPNPQHEHHHPSRPVRDQCV